MTQHISEYSVSRSSRSIDRFMIIVGAIMVFALCTNYTAAAQHPNLLEQMEGDLSELSSNAGSWSMYSLANNDTIAQDAYDIGLWSDCACWEDLDTTDGYIEILDYNVPTEIPLCLTDEWIDPFFVKVKVVGGYTYVGQHLFIEQEKTGLKYCIDIVEDKMDEYPCGVVIYTFGFELKGDVDYVFEANNIPQVIGGPFSVKPPEGDLNKWIDVHYCGVWTGCDEPDQQFLISMVQPNYGHYELCVTFSIIY